jgi:glycosyltransferase involved in cell wall biosynthesis
MKIILIAPGFKPLPPQGWGAVESIVWDYYTVLSKKFENIAGNHNHNQVVIVNRTNPIEIVREANSHPDADVVHIMYDDYIVVVPYLNCPLIFYTSHFAYLTHPHFESQYAYYFQNIFTRVLEYSHKIFLMVISDKIFQKYAEHGFPPQRMSVLQNGAREDVFQYKPIAPLHPGKSIYLAKIEERKAQYLYQSIPSIDFVGNYASSQFDIRSVQYLGEWDKPKLYQSMTDYANLVLLSDGEADPLVVKEALMAGLGLVISSCCTANLDLSKPFITVVPNGKLGDVEYVRGVIEQNRKVSLAMRDEIRAYALKEFSWDRITDKYLLWIQYYSRFV